MSINWRYVVGTGTIVGILGLTGYSIYLYRKQKKEDEQAIGVDEAREMSRDVESEYKHPIMENVEEEMDDIRGDYEVSAKIVSPIAVPVDDIVEEEIEEEELLAEEESEEILNDNVEHEYEGDGKLRYDPDSEQALEQFFKMELAEWDPEDDIYKGLYRLFNLVYVPTNDGDKNVYTNMIDYRVEFFGRNSRWIDAISVADLILYYARKADYELGGSVRFWASEFMTMNELDEFEEDDILKDVIHEMVHHRLYNEAWDSYGLFGLDEYHWGYVHNISSRNLDGMVTFDMEFSGFLKQNL